MKNKHKLQQYDDPIIKDEASFYSKNPTFIRFNVEIIAGENNLEKIITVKNIIKTLHGNKLCFEKITTEKDLYGKNSTYYKLYVPGKFVTPRNFKIFKDLGLDVDSIFTNILRKSRRKNGFKRVHL